MMKLTILCCGALVLLAGPIFSQAAIITNTKYIPGTEVSFEMAYFPGSEVLMNDGAVKVKLNSFWIGTHEVTYDEYRLFQVRENDSDVGADGAADYDAITRPSPPYLDFTNGMGTRGGFPAVSMTQQAALRYCQWLYQKTGEFYRLPTEAEWEYACKAGASGHVPVGYDADKMEEFGWFYENSFEKYHPVKEKRSNGWALHDMLGNVAEWTLDDYREDYWTEVAADPDNPWMVPTKKHSRTVRGGSYDTPMEECTCTMRQKSQAKWQARDPQIPKSRWWNPDSPFVGFRLLKPVQQPEKAEVEAFFAKAIVD